MADVPDIHGMTPYQAVKTFEAFQDTLSKTPLRILKEQGWLDYPEFFVPNSEGILIKRALNSRGAIPVSQLPSQIATQILTFDDTPVPVEDKAGVQIIGAYQSSGAPLTLIILDQATEVYSQQVPSGAWTLLTCWPIIWYGGEVGHQVRAKWSGAAGGTQYIVGVKYA